MTSQEIEHKVREILSNKFGVGMERISGDTRLAEDLGVDSFGAVELMFEIEEAFGMEIPESDFGHVKSVRDVVAYLEEWLGKAAQAQAPT